MIIDQSKVKFIRYPGGKQRLFNYIKPYLPLREQIKGNYVEPFVGGGAVFFALNPKHALLSDINKELMELYRGIRLYPMKIWKIYKRFPKTKIAYYKIRNLKNSNDLAFRAARTLYLNRTCFKGMWRYNSRGEFNIGYGGQSRRWVINYKNLHYVSTRLKNKSLKCCDFESIIDNCTKDDFIFLDPPYRPGNCEMIHSHYTYSNFEYDEHKRLAAVLKRATKKGVRWILTNSSHPRILHLFRDNWINFLQLGTGNKLGKLTKNPNEVLIRNYKEVFR